MEIKIYKINNPLIRKMKMKNRFKILKIKKYQSNNKNIITITNNHKVNNKMKFKTDNCVN